MDYWSCSEWHNIERGQNANIKLHTYSLPSATLKFEKKELQIEIQGSNYNSLYSLSKID